MTSATVYAFYATLLKLIDWQRPGERWLLKSPAHLWGLDHLNTHFPDACFVQTHRDPAAVVASYCSMMSALMSIREHVDPIALGNAVLGSLGLAIERAMSARQRVGDSRFVDVHYSDFVRDPMSVVEKIYAHFAFSLDGRARQAMQSHIRDNPGNRHGRHHYDLKQWGITRAQVYERFETYIRHFDVQVGAPV